MAGQYAGYMQTAGGLSDDTNRMYREGKWGSFALRIFFSTFFGSVFFGFFLQISRGLNALSPLIGFELVPALIAGGAFYVATRLVRRFNGGHVYWMPMTLLWLIGLALKSRTHTVRTNGRSETRAIFSEADGFVTKLHFVTWFFMTIAMLAGYYVGGLLAWVGLDGGAQPAPNLAVTPYSPGPFPGMNAAFWPHAALVESLGSFIISALIVGPLLVGRSELVAPSAGIAVVVATLISFNLSGGAFDLAWWTMSHLAACTPSGNPCFPGAAEWWWVYVLFGPLVGSLLGVLAAFVFFLASDLKQVRRFFTAEQAPAVTFAGAYAPPPGAYAPQSAAAPLAAHVAPAAVPSVGLGPTSAALFGQQ